MSPEEEKEELQEETAPLSNRDDSPEQVNPTEEKSEDLAGEGQIEEEIVLDEVLAEEDEAPEPDSQENLKEEEPEEDKAAGKGAAPRKGPDKKGTFVFFRKKWAFTLSAGLLVLLILGIGYGFLSVRQGKLLDLNGLIGRQTKGGRALVETVLKPFFVPQPENSENAAVKLVVSVLWNSGTLITYRKEPVRVRDEVYQYLLQEAGSGKDFAKEKQSLASGLSTVLQHALAVKDIRVRVHDIAPI